jgi:hypothetical protein
MQIKNHSNQPEVNSQSFSHSLPLDVGAGLGIQLADTPIPLKQNPPSRNIGLGQVLNKSYGLRQQNLPLNPPLQPYP